MRRGQTKDILGENTKESVKPLLRYMSFIARTRIQVIPTMYKETMSPCGDNALPWPGKPVACRHETFDELSVFKMRDAKLNPRYGGVRNGTEAPSVNGEQKQNDIERFTGALLQ